MNQYIYCNLLDFEIWPISGQCSFSIPPKNSRENLILEKTSIVEKTSLYLMGIVSLRVTTPTIRHPFLFKAPFLKHFQATPPLNNPPPPPPPPPPQPPSSSNIFFTSRSSPHHILMALFYSYLTFLFNSPVAIKTTDNFSFPF